ncbi:hypothetical protein B566_EDAN004067, partial [Ephemera danica]
MPGYEIYRVDRLHKGGGGVAIYVRNDIKCKILATSNQDDKNQPEFIMSELTFGYKKVLFTTIYRPPNATFIDDVDSKISLMGAGYDHIIITGDLNIDLLKETPMKKKLLDSFACLGLSLTNYSNPTHIHSYRDLPTLIDIFACNNILNIKSYGQLEAPGFSHHDLIYINYSIKSNKYQSRKITFRDIKKIDTQRLIIDAAKISSNNLNDYNDVDDMVEYLRNEIIALYDKHAPTRTVQVKHKPTPWRTQEIVELEARRDRAFSKYKKSKKKSGLIKHENPYFEEYRILRNKCNQVSRNAKINYAHKELNGNQPSSLLWKKVNKIGLGKQYTPKTNINFSLDEINNFFTTLPQGIDVKRKRDTLNKLKCSSNDKRNKYMKPSFKLKPVCTSEVKYHIKKIKTKAIGQDDLGIDLLSPILDTILPVLTYIINESIKRCKFPTAWKKSHINPIPKCQNPTELKDFRPISILPLLSKVIEKLVQSQVIDYLIETCQFDEMQSGFRAKHSTSTALLKILEDIRKAQDTNMVTVLILLDFSKAFDTVNHEILLAKLLNLNFDSETISWFRSYLSDRSQRVIYNGEKSDWLPVEHGVPQGSVLGPLLFAIYILDGPKALKNSHYHCYADDFQIYQHTKLSNLNDCINSINEDLKAVHKWSLENLLLFNSSKTQPMIIGNGHTPLNKIQSQCKPIILTYIGTLIICNIFAIYILDGPKALKNSHYHCYADDFQIYQHTKLSNLNDCINSINEDLKAVHK